jgi:hypothetical protein
MSASRATEVLPLKVGLKHSLLAVIPCSILELLVFDFILVVTPVLSRKTLSSLPPSHESFGLQLFHPGLGALLGQVVLVVLITH